jgi:hypothetical protein
MHASDPPVTRRSAMRARLEDRGVPDLAKFGLRPEVHSSWMRSELSGIDPDHFTPQYEPDQVRDGRFVAVCAEVIDHALTGVDVGPTGVMLTDAHGRIQRTWSGEKAVRDFRWRPRKRSRSAGRSISSPPTLRSSALRLRFTTR